MMPGSGLAILDQRLGNSSKDVNEWNEFQKPKGRSKSDEFQRQMNAPDALTKRPRTDVPSPHSGRQFGAAYDGPDNETSRGLIRGGGAMALERNKCAAVCCDARGLHVLL